MRLRHRKTTIALAVLSTTALALTAPAHAAASHLATQAMPKLPSVHAQNGQNLPFGAVPGSTPQRRAAWNALSAAQKNQAIASFEYTVTPRIEPLVAAAAKGAGAPAPTGAWKSVLGGGTRPSGGPAATFSKNAPPAAPTALNAHGAPSAVRPMDSTDGDGDGLPDDFEQNLADAFTPVYHVSAGEAPGTGFATFEQNVPQEIVQSVSGPVPPMSYFAVAPLGLATGANGQTLLAVRIDYFTLWNRDDGLQIDDTCSFGLDVLLGLVGVGVGAVLDGASSHALDNERSAALVAAPLNPDGSVDLNPGDYSAYSYYTAAHEGTFLDHSAYLNPSSPVPAYNHLNLALSVSKHSTYTFNPDGMPLMPAGVIDAVYSTILFLEDDGEIDPDTADLYLFLADDVFYGCIIEHFGDQGGAFAAPRINVGEPGSPLNGSAFIADPELAPKFAPLW
jgi:hypothetical protein